MIERVIKDINFLLEEYSQVGGFGDKYKTVDYPKSIPYADDINIFYSNYNPIGELEINFGSSVLYLFPLEEIAKSQSGYRTDINGIVDPEWENAFVIGVIDDEPIIADVSNEITVIKASYESGPLLEISENIEQFFLAVLCVLKIQYTKFNNDPLDHITLDFKPNFIEEVENNLLEILSKEHADNFIDFFFG